MLCVLVPNKSRFWPKVDKTPGQGPNGDCWEWQAGRNSYGHGHFNSFCYDGKVMKQTGAHRHSWILAHGNIPKGLSVLHKCDNPPCVNPAHLFLGTQLDNMRDCANKGRISNQNVAKTHCILGHPLSGENLYMYKGERGCKVCRARLLRESRERKKKALNVG